MVEGVSPGKINGRTYNTPLFIVHWDGWAIGSIAVSAGTCDVRL